MCIGAAVGWPAVLVRHCQRATPILPTAHFLPVKNLFTFSFFGMAQGHRPIVYILPMRLTAITGTTAPPPLLQPCATGAYLK